MKKRYGCLCCGYCTLDAQPPGTHTICPVCWWEDDAVQARDPSYAGGANAVSLSQAKESFRAVGVSDARFASNVRPPRIDEIPENFAK